MTISIRLSDDDTMLIKKYADMHNLTVSELVRKAIMEKIEDEIDLAAYEKAMEEYKADPATYSHDEVKKMLGLD